MRFNNVHGIEFIFDNKKQLPPSNKIVPENTTKADFTLIDTGRQRDGKKVNSVDAFLLVDGVPRWIWLSEADVELL